MVPHGRDGAGMGLEQRLRLVAMEARSLSCPGLVFLGRCFQLKHFSVLMFFLPELLHALLASGSGSCSVLNLCRALWGSGTRALMPDYSLQL